MAAAQPRGSGVWARGLGVALVRSSEPSAPLSPELEQAARDGVERGYDGPLPEVPPGSVCLLVRVGGETVGLLGYELDTPRPGAGMLHGVAIAPEHRGREYGSRAVLVAARRLRREGVGSIYARAPRGNGRGLYFWLHVGFAPVRGRDGDEDDGTTWFRRAEALR